MPLSRWSSAELADELVAAGVVESICPGTVRRWLCHDALKPWHRLRTEGRPGITGLWQVVARNQVTFDQSVILDIYYLTNASFWGDLKIMAITPLRMLFGVGSY